MMLKTVRERAEALTGARLELSITNVRGQDVLYVFSDTAVLEIARELLDKLDTEAAAQEIAHRLTALRDQLQGRR